MDKRSGRRLPFVTEDSTPTRGEGLTPISIWLEFLALTRRLVDDRIAVDLTGDFLLSGLFDPLRRNRVLSCSKVKRTESFAPSSLALAAWFEVFDSRLGRGPFSSFMML